MKTAKVQIRLNGNDAKLYELIQNKKGFFLAAMRLFAQDEKLRTAFFSNPQEAAKLISTEAEEEMAAEEEKKPTPPLKASQEKPKKKDIEVKW